MQCCAYLTSRNSEDSSAPFARYLKQEGSGASLCRWLHQGAVPWPPPSGLSAEKSRCQQADQGDVQVQREHHGTRLPTKTVSPGDTMVWKLGYVMGRQLLDA